MDEMNRRELLGAGVAGLMASALPAGEAQSHGSVAANGFTVRAGDGRPGGQWSVHGEKAFSTKVSGADVKQAYAVLEIHTPPGRGPEVHVHLAQNELFYLLSGSIGMQCGPDRSVLRKGDTLMVPAGVAHAFVTIGEEPAHMLNVFNPSGDIENFSPSTRPWSTLQACPTGQSSPKLTASTV